MFHIKFKENFLLTSLCLQSSLAAPLLLGSVQFDSAVTKIMFVVVISDFIIHILTLYDI